MSKRNPNLLRVGDKAKVLIPNRFIRCGYNITPLIAAEQLIDEHSKEIVEFLDIIGINGDRYRKTGQWEFKSTTNNIDIDARGMRTFMKALGYLKVNKDGFGGTTRKVHSEPVSILEGAIIKVIETRHVMTGEYFAPSGSYSSYEGDYDYEPGGLTNQKSNRILKVRVSKRNLADQHMWSEPNEHEHQQWDGLWIEANNCERITEEEMV
jgi:hypothetical protein